MHCSRVLVPLYLSCLIVCILMPDTKISKPFQECEDLSSGPTGDIGRREVTGEREVISEREITARSHEVHTCDYCCSTDLCNNNCNGNVTLTPGRGIENHLRLNDTNSPSIFHSIIECYILNHICSILLYGMLLRPHFNSRILFISVN